MIGPPTVGCERLCMTIDSTPVPSQFDPGYYVGHPTEYSITITCGDRSYKLAAPTMYEAFMMLDQWKERQAEEK